MPITNPTILAIRSRFAQSGAEALSDHELVALLIGPGGGRRSAAEPLGLAERALGQAGGLWGLARAEISQIARLDGVGEARACRLKAAVEIGRRLAVPDPPRGRPIESAGDVAEWYRCRLQGFERECIHALLLDSKHRPLRQLRVSEGSWTSCHVDPKVVFAACLRDGAPAVILVHNHPSGDPTPSRDDLELTERMVRAGKLVGVTVVDHLVVGRCGYTSMADSGLI